MIGRDVEAAAALSYDLLIVGAGIQGVTLALESVRRGLKPLLIDRGDFGGATSWNSMRTVHGGLRSLQTLDWPRFHASVRERSWFLRHFPDQLERLPCLMPLYGQGLKRPSVLRAALGLNDLLSGRRNRGLSRDHRLPAGRVLSAGETERAFPGVARAGLRGAALWYDALMPDSQRLLIELLRWSVSFGAQALNYVRADELFCERGRVAGIRGTDCQTREAFEFRAPIVVNAAGPWSRELAAAFDRDVPELFHPSIAIGAFLDRDPLSEYAVAVTPPAPGSRTYFVYPWKGRLMAGTYHAAWSGSIDAVEPGEALVADFLDQLNRAIPGFDLTRGDVLRLHWGFLPAVRPGSDTLSVREVICDHGAKGGPRGLYSVSGVKFTTARAVAEKTLRAIGVRAPALDIPRPPPQPVPEAEQVATRLAADPEGLRAEVLALVRSESVVQFEDLMLRRTDWGIAPRWSAAITAGLPRLLGLDALR